MTQPEWESARRLPADPEYWDRLAARVLENATASEFAVATGVDPWWSVFASSSRALVAAAILAIVSGALLVGERTPATGPIGPIFGSVLGSSLAPEDPMLQRLLEEPVAPSSEILLGLASQRRNP